VIEIREVVVEPPPSFLVSCKHPLPETEDAMLNIDVYRWLSDYQVALESCNNKIESIRGFYAPLSDKQAK